jgi:hypothetical protein
VSSAVIARTTAEQVRHVRELRVARARQHAHRRALRRCEDLAELLGALSAPQGPRRAARLRAAARVAARDLHRTVAGHRPGHLLPRRGDRRLTTLELDGLVEQLDAALCAAHAGRRGAHRRVLHLAATVAAGVEALSPEPPAMTAAVPHHPGRAPRGLGDLHHRLAAVQLDVERLLDRLDGDGDLHAPLAAVAGRLHDLGDALLDAWTALGDAHPAGAPR